MINGYTIMKDVFRKNKHFPSTNPYEMPYLGFLKVGDFEKLIKLINVQKR